MAKKQPAKKAAKTKKPGRLTAKQLLAFSTAAGEHYAEEAKDKGGRPSKKTPELLQAIGMGLADGTALTVVCERLTAAGTPIADRTVREWQETDPEVSAAIARAREEGEMAIASRLRKVARGVVAAEGEEPLSSGDVQRDKLIVDLDLKLLAKFNPKRWGDKVQHADAEGNKLPPAPQFLLQPVMTLPVKEDDPA